MIQLPVARRNTSFLRPSAHELEGELDALGPASLLVESNAFRVYMAEARAIPRTLVELGRLRAEAFPGAFAPGDVDLDEFDASYRHLWVWNTEEREIVGGYRLGCSDVLAAARHPERLYTHQLFEYDPRLLRELDPALELGRSFVTPAYQRSYAALNLLWRGIGVFLARNRRYRYVFGALTIPHDLSPGARDCCLAFLDELAVPERWAGLARGRVSVDGWDRESGAIAPAASLDELEEQLARVDSRGVPPLLRHYTRLGARTFDFSQDPSFGGSVDALIVVDLAAAPPAILARFLGPEAAAAFARPGRAQIPLPR